MPHTTKPPATLPVQPPAKPVSIGEVAGRAGVSAATVSRVLNGVTGKTSEQTRVRVLQAVEALGYRPSRAGSTLRQGRSHLVGLLAPDPGNAYNASVAASVERALRAEGRILVLGNTQEDPAVQDDLLREMRSLLVGGIVLLGAVPSPYLDECLRDGTPMVFLNRRSPTRQRAPYVGIDNDAAGRAVAAHLAACGYRDVAVFHGPMTSSASRGRVQGFRTEFVRRVGAAARIRLHRTSIDRMGSGYALTGAVLAEGQPDAIFCTTDEIAYGAAKRCHEHRLRVPQDVALFGFDGNPLNAYLAPWLSTIEVPYDEFGPAAARVLQCWWATGQAPTGDTLLPFRVAIAPS